MRPQFVGDSGIGGDLGLKLLNVPQAQWILLGGLIALGVGLATYGVVAWRARPRLQTASG